MELRWYARERRQIQHHTCPWEDIQKERGEDEAVGVDSGVKRINFDAKSGKRRR